VNPLDDPLANHQKLNIPRGPQKYQSPRLPTLTGKSMSDDIMG
jgi:hypothetical protein